MCNIGNLRAYQNVLEKKEEFTPRSSIWNELSNIKAKENIKLKQNQARKINEKKSQFFKKNQ